MLSQMPKSSLINLLRLPRSPLPSTLHTNLPLCDQSKKNSRGKKKKRCKGVSVGIAHTPNAGGKAKHTVSCWSMKNQLVFVGRPHFPVGKKGNSPSTASKSSLGVVNPPWSLRDEALGLLAESPGGSCCLAQPWPWSLRGCPLAPLKARHHPRQWQGLAAPLEFLREGFSFLPALAQLVPFFLPAGNILVLVTVQGATH